MKSVTKKLHSYKNHKKSLRFKEAQLFPIFQKESNVRELFLQRIPLLHETFLKDCMSSLY